MSYNWSLNQHLFDILHDRTQLRERKSYSSSLCTSSSSIDFNVVRHFGKSCQNPSFFRILQAKWLVVLTQSSLFRSYKVHLTYGTTQEVIIITPIGRTLYYVGQYIGVYILGAQSEEARTVPTTEKLVPIRLVIAYVIAFIQQFGRPNDQHAFCLRGSTVSALIGIHNFVTASL